MRERIYKTNAERQKAYRERLRKKIDKMERQLKKLQQEGEMNDLGKLWCFCK